MRERWRGHWRGTNLAGQSRSLCPGNSGNGGLLLPSARLQKAPTPRGCPTALPEGPEPQEALLPSPSRAPATPGGQGQPSQQSHGTSLLVGPGPGPHLQLRQMRPDPLLRHGHPALPADLGGGPLPRPACSEGPGCRTGHSEAQFAQGLSPSAAPLLSRGGGRSQGVAPDPSARTCDLQDGPDPPLPRATPQPTALPVPSKLGALPSWSGPQRPLGPPAAQWAAEGSSARPLPAPARPVARDSGAPARPPSSGRSTRRGAAPTVLPRGGSRVHCLRGGGGGGGGARAGAAVSGRPRARARARARAASPRRLGSPRRAVRADTAPRGGAARGARCHSCSPHHTPCPPRAWRGRGPRALRRARSGARAGARGAERGAPWGQPPAPRPPGRSTFPAKMRRASSSPVPAPSAWPRPAGRGRGRGREALPEPWAGRWRSGWLSAARHRCSPGVTLPGGVRGQVQKPARAPGAVGEGWQPRLCRAQVPLSSYRAAHPGLAERRSVLLSWKRDLLSGEQQRGL